MAMRDHLNMRIGAENRSDKGPETGISSRSRPKKVKIAESFFAAYVKLFA